MLKSTAIFLILLATVSPAVAGGFPVAEGWFQSGAVETYGPDNLWKYNNGAAELYLVFGFQEVRACRLLSGERTVSVGIFDMGTRLGAFGIFNAEAGSPGERLSIGAGTVFSLPYQCSMFKGRHYVIIDTSPGNLDEEWAEHLLRSIAERLPGDNRLPDELRALPTEGKVSGSERYARESFLGMGVLKNCVYASYTFSETDKEDRAKEEYRVFLLLPGAGRFDKDTWAELRAAWKPVDHGPTPLLMKKISYQGPAVVALTEEGIFGVVGPAEPERAAEILLRVTAGARDID